MDNDTLFRQAREQLGFTQVALARLLGVSQTHISRVEIGETPLNPILRDRLHALLQKGAVCDPCDRRYPFVQHGHRLRYCSHCRAPLRPELCPRCYLPVLSEELAIACVFCGYDLTTSEEGGLPCPSSPSTAMPPPSR